MIIEKGKFYHNKTSKYIAIIFKEYGKELINRLNKLMKLAIGINDKALPDKLKFNNHLFILVDTQANTDYFIESIEWLRENNYLTFDYPFDDIEEGYMHMLVIEIPKRYKHSLQQFIYGNYSKMYTENQLKELFLPDDSRLGVLRREYSAIEKFLKEVEHKYDTKVRPVEWDGEADYPLFSDEEYFNNHLN